MHRLMTSPKKVAEDKHSSLFKATKKRVLYNFSLKIDSGEVMCIAANGVPPIISHKFRIVVQCKSTITGYPTTSGQAREVLLKGKDQYG